MILKVLILLLLITFIFYSLQSYPVMPSIIGGATKDITWENFNNKDKGWFKERIDKNKDKIKIIQKSSNLPLRTINKTDIIEYFIFNIIDTETHFLYILDKSNGRIFETIFYIPTENIPLIKPNNGVLPINTNNYNDFACGSLSLYNSTPILNTISSMGNNCNGKSMPSECNDSFLNGLFKAFHILFTKVLDYNDRVILLDMASTTVKLTYKGSNGVVVNTIDGAPIIMKRRIAYDNFDNGTYDKENPSSISIYNKYGFKYFDEHLIKNAQKYRLRFSRDGGTENDPSGYMYADNIDCFNRCDNNNDNDCPKKRTTPSKAQFDVSKYYELVSS